jgi:hypothetical protein
MNSMQLTRIFVAIAAVWVVAALAVALYASRAMVIVVLPIAAVLWFAVHAQRVKQSTQLVLPVLLLPGALMCFVGVMQAFGYGRMADEPMMSNAPLRAAFFAL